MDSIGLVVGQRGRNVQELQQRFSSQVSIESDGLVTVASNCSQRNEMLQLEIGKFIVNYSDDTVMLLCCC